MNEPQSQRGGGGKPKRNGGADDERPAVFAASSRRVLLKDGLREAALLVRGESIVSIVPPTALPSGIAVEDFGDLVVMPGLVDCHVHINEPGRAEWEGFETATRAAAAGGVTTVV